MKEASPDWQDAAMLFDWTAAVRAAVGGDIVRQHVGIEVRSRV